MESLLKRKFTNYNIYDATNKMEYQLNKALELCKQIPHLLVFMKRNENNKSFLKEYEDNSINGTPITWIFFNKDRFLSFFENNDQIFNSKEKTLSWMVKSINELIDKNSCCECCICYEKFNIEEGQRIHTCQQCGSSCCTQCISRYLDVATKKELKCPICRECVLVYI